MADFELISTRGDTIRILVPVTRNNAPVDLTGATLYFTAKRRKTDLDAEAVIQKSTLDGITITDELNGQAVIIIQPANTSFLEDEPRLYCDVEVIEANGTRTTVARGRLTIQYDISRV